MIICNSRKFIFIHIHKTGGTSVERALDRHLAWNDLILGGSRFGEEIQAAYSKKHGLNKHSTASDIERICGSDILDRYYSFALVRDPVARMCSMYNYVGTTLSRWATKHDIALKDIANHISRKAVLKNPGLKWASSKAFLASGCFSEFIRHPQLAQAPAFRSQVSSLVGSGSGTLRARYFRLEDLPAWVDELRGELGLELEIGQDNESTTKLVDGVSISNDDRSYLENLFRSDYELLGYRC